MRKALRVYSSLGSVNCAFSVFLKYYLSWKPRLLDNTEDVRIYQEPWVRYGMSDPDQMQLWDVRHETLCTFWDFSKMMPQEGNCCIPNGLFMLQFPTDLWIPRKELFVCFNLPSVCILSRTLDMIWDERPCPGATVGRATWNPVYVLGFQ